LKKYLSLLNKPTWILRIFSFKKVPMIFYTRPWIQDLSLSKIEVVIPLNRKTKNHLNSMYFGALCVGADVAGGFLALSIIQNKKKDVSIIFKDFKAEFLKRPEDNVHFYCEDGQIINVAIDKAISTSERCNVPITIKAMVPIIDLEPVAIFSLTLSLKSK
tara:strand:- start:878 stop:1357 length:480 start_codon:yes stop_codon:yes gene_type:complete